MNEIYAVFLKNQGREGGRGEMIGIPEISAHAGTTSYIPDAPEFSVFGSYTCLRRGGDTGVS